MNNWKFITRYGKNKIVQRTYIFLFLVPFLITTLVKFDLSRIIEAIPFSWHMFFYSSVFFTLGNLVYQLFAPSIIKDNNSYYDFSLESKNWDHLDLYAEELNIPFDDYTAELKSYRGERYHDIFTKEQNDTFIQSVPASKHRMYNFLYEYFRKQKTTTPPSRLGFGHVADNPTLNFETYKHYGEELDRNSKHNLKVAFWKVYEFAKTERNTSRTICLILYIIGTALISLVTINSIYIVVKNGLTVWIN